MSLRRPPSFASELTRRLRLAQLLQHAESGSILGGVHLELTGEVNSEGFSVTECTGGSMGLEDKDLSTNYQVRLCARELSIATSS